MGKKGKGKKSKGPPPPPPEETHLLHIGNFATVETKETSVSLTPCIVTPTPDKTPTVLAEEELKTCGMLRIHIEPNKEGNPEYQIKLLKAGDPELEELCKKRSLKEKREPVNYKLEEHGLPDIKDSRWLKEPLTFPVLIPPEVYEKRPLKKLSSD